MAGSGRARLLQEVATGDKRMRPAIASKHEDESTRAQPPQLNVVTKFPMDLSRSTVKGMERGRKESLQVRRNMSRKIKNRDAMKGPIGSLRRADSKVSELSPSDATLLIGISIPSLNHMTTVNSLGKVNQIPQSINFDEKRSQPLAPEIIVTAAKLEGDWLDTDRHEEPRTQAKEIPLVETRITQPKKGSRIESWGTIIDEGCSPDTPTGQRPYSAESQLVMLKRSSVDTNATRPRSKGWWNQILSPFLERSNTFTTRKSLVNKEKKVLSQVNPKREVVQSPDATELEEDSLRSVPSSTWTDMSRWEAERRTMGFADYKHQNRSIDPLNIPGEIVVSPGFEPVAGFGAASEYYEACWHDQNSPTPFFHCQNHDCSQFKPLDPSCMNSQSSEQDLDQQALNPRDASSSKNAADGSSEAFRQTPANRFSAAFAESRASRLRPTSGTTIMEEDLESTPAIEEARAAPVVRARIPVITIPNGPNVDGAIGTLPGRKREVLRTIGENELPESGEIPVSSASVPPRSPAVASRSLAAGHDEIKSPEAITPHYEQSMASSEAIGLKRMSKNLSPSQPFQPTPTIYNINQYLGRAKESPVHKLDELTTLYPPPPIKPWSKGEEKRWIRASKQDQSRSEDAGIKRSRSVDTRTNLSEIQDRRRRIEDQKRKNKKRRCLYFLIIGGLLALIALILGLTIGLTQQHTDMPVQSAWLNITGYPPIPVGIMTIAQPSAVVENNGCVQPSTMWSCALPKEQQASIVPNASDEPNFRVEIRYNNGSIAANTTSSSSKVRRSKRHVGNAVSAGFKTRTRILRIRDAFTDTLYTPAPSPPSSEDQVFLGNTTDYNTAPFEGEYTPFFIGFLSTTLASSKFRRRQSPSDSNTTNPFPNITQAIPPPNLNSDGTAAAANLLPFPSAQPIRLYNRGQANEHYGFYNYFDRSIFLKSAAVLNSSSDAATIPDDENGGSSENAATIRCTWAQTRFLVQIWTNLGSSSTLLPSANSSSTTTSSSGTQTNNASTSSANDFSRPGSFPYPVTITLDRHGGDIDTKMLYCYGMDTSEHIVPSEKQFQIETRGFGGTLVNPAEGVFGNVNVTYAQGGPGGIDGGTGGCSCQWRNWMGKG